jgi:biopolymer transport protein ExbD
MSLQSSRRKRRRPELPLVPLIDVLVMLVLFAYVTMQARSAATLNITLPKVETAGKNEFRGNITIAIAKDGAMSFNGKAITEAELGGLLAQVRDVDKNIPVLIRADVATQLGTVTSVWDLCRKNGMNKISFVTR